MSIAEKFDLSNAMYARAVANTPLFLLRKLQEDQAVRAFADSFTGEELLDAFAESVQHKPRNPKEAVLPYVLLVALFFNAQLAYLRKAASIKPNYEDEWLTYVLHVLLETYRPGSKQIIELKSNPTTSVTSSAASHQIILPRPVVEAE